MKDCGLSLAFVIAWLLGAAWCQAVQADLMAGPPGGGTSKVIAPPPGAAFRDPAVLPNQSAASGVFEASLEARPASISINGSAVELMTYNGEYPAPTIKVKKGDLLKVHFTNALPYDGDTLLGHRRGVTNLHPHGLHVSPSGASDNVAVSLQPGESFDYEFDLSQHAGGNLNFYHPHVHGLTAEQLWAGLAGALEVADDVSELAAYETHILMLKDIRLAGSKPAPLAELSDYRNGMEGDTVMVNGQINPVLNLRPRQVQRWRIVNASNARFYKLALERHVLRVIGTDGGLLDKPYPMDSLLLAPGERVDVLVKASAIRGSYTLLAQPYDRGTGIARNERVSLLTAKVQGKPFKQRIPASIDPAAARLAVPADAPVRRMVLGMGMMGGGMMGDGSSLEATINGISYSETEAYTADSSVGSYEIWEISNMSMMDHPFHQHVNPAQVISIQGGDASYAAFYTGAPAWKDTVVVPKHGTVRMLVPIRDFSGTTVFHCHILEHEDAGMMGLWNIR